MAFTTTYTVDATGDPEAIVANTVCKRIKVFETAQAGTAQLKLRQPAVDSEAVTYPEGKAIELENPGGYWHPEEIAGYVETNSGAVTVCQVEE